MRDSLIPWRCVFFAISVSQGLRFREAKGTEDGCFHFDSAHERSAQTQWPYRTAGRSRIPHPISILAERMEPKTHEKKLYGLTHFERLLPVPAELHNGGVRDRTGDRLSRLMPRSCLRPLWRSTTDHCPAR